MNITKILAYIYDRKNILYSIVSCLIGLVFQIIGMIICEKTFLNYLFVWIIPIAAIIILGTYAVSMTDQHPILLNCPNLIYFLSVFIRFLITREFVLFFLCAIEAVPFIVFQLRFIKTKLYTPACYAMKIAIAFSLCIAAAMMIVIQLTNRGVVSITNHVTLQCSLTLMMQIPYISMCYTMFLLNRDVVDKK